MFFKISIIGTNHFCEKLALTLLYLKNINQIILYSIKKKMHQRKAFNLLEFFNLKKLKNKKILYTNKIKKIKNSNILIINAGIKKIIFAELYPSEVAEKLLTESQVELIQYKKSNYKF